jgi:hypothetical protein
MSFDIFKIEHSVYDKSKATALVLKIKKYKLVEEKYKSNEKRLNELRLELFAMMSKIVVKNINNYLKLCYNSPVKDESFVSYEMQSEAFLILIKCIEKFKFNKGFCFYFYYNKSLSRSFYKIFSQTIRDKENMGLVSDIIQVRSRKSTNEHYSVEFVISQFKLDEDELRILDSKLLGQSKIDFLQANKDFNMTKYHKCNQKVKLIIQKFLENGEL